MKRLIIIFILMLGLITAVSAEKQVNSWDVGFNSDYYNKYITSSEISVIPVKIDFSKREHTLEFYIDNINERGMPNYVRISNDENNSKVTIHLAGEHNNLARVISPENYDPRISYSVNYNNKRRIVVNFVMPSKFDKNDVFQLGLRAKSLDGDNKQILLNLMSDYPTDKKEVDMMPIIYLLGALLGGIIFIWFFFLRRKGGVKNENF